MARRSRALKTRFVTWEEFRSGVDSAPYLGPDYPSHWYGDDSKASAIRAIKEGARAEVIERAEALMGRLDCAIETPERVREMSVAGASLSVGAYLSGSPLCFRRKRAKATDSAPVRIIVDRTSSAALDPKTVEAVGITMLALALKLQAIRPVEIWVCSAVGGGNDTLMAVNLGLAPIDLSTLSVALTSVSFVRGFLYGWSCKIGGASGDWPSKPFRSLLEGTELEPTETDIVLPPIHIDDPIVQDPEAWIQSQLARYAPEG